ncbi:MAG: hypothetical protein SFU84_13420 [Gemmatimonadales bacterium]|nr:hypothetical protein [Gemmatimonadales bacterium]
MLMELTAVYRRVGGGYVAWAREVPGANTQGDTLEAESGELLTEILRISG